MAEQTGSQEDRTEAATPRRLQRAREEGQVPVSREAATLAGLAAVTLALAVSGPALTRDLVQHLGIFLGRADQASLVGADGLRFAGLALLRSALPILVMALLAGVGAVLLQTGMLLNAKALQPRLNRLSPGAGLRRLLGLDNLVEALKSVAKVTVVGFAIWHVLAGELPRLTALPFQDAAALPERLLPLLMRVLLTVLAVQVVIAAADLFWVRLRHARSMRMSRQDVRDEQKETEGDPRIKAQIRQIRLQRARRRMLAAVPKATVVVTNPTHYAVALVYDRATSAAPKVVAKGIDSMAARIREAAAAAKAPLVANPPLARALYQV
jgi:flagellar biosynthesis protein FlhB